MKEIKWYCDHCGKQIKPITDYVGEELGILVNEEVDLCTECVEEFDKIVLNFCKKGEAD